MRGARWLVAWGFVLTACCSLMACGSAGGGGDAGVDAGADGGMDGGIAAGCSLEAQDCPSGQTCMRVRTGTGSGGQEVLTPQCVADGCNVVTQGCGQGQECRYVAGDGGTAERGCAPETGSGAEGDSCVYGLPDGGDDGSDSCGTGLVCAGEQAPDGGVVNQRCQRLCLRDADCGQSQLCLSALKPRVGATDERPGICLRVTFCDPLTQNCPSTQACYVVDNDAICRPEGLTPVGQPCATADSCVKGSTCAGSPDGGTACRELCDPAPGGTPSCASGTCARFQSYDAGVCIPP